MEQQNKKITLQTNEHNTKKRIDNLILQFNEWKKSRKNPNPTSISLCFYTSDEHPLTMGEIALFLNSITDVLDGCGVEWDHKADETMCKQIRLEINSRYR